MTEKIKTIYITLTYHIYFLDSPDTFWANVTYFISIIKIDVLDEPVGGATLLRKF